MQRLGDLHFQPSYSHICKNLAGFSCCIWNNEVPILYSNVCQILFLKFYIFNCNPVTLKAYQWLPVLPFSVVLLDDFANKLSFYNNEPSKNKHFLILLSSLARNSQEPKLKRIFEIPWVLFEKSLSSKVPFCQNWKDFLKKESQDFKNSFQSEYLWIPSKTGEQN